MYAEEELYKKLVVGGEWTTAELNTLKRVFKEVQQSTGKLGPPFYLAWKEATMRLAQVEGMITARKNGL